MYYSLQLKAPSGTLGTTAGFLAGLTNFAIPTPSNLTVPQAGLRYQRVSGTTYQIGIQTNNTSATPSTPARRRCR